MATAHREPEDLVIRPPSEAASILVRVTRGCAWSRCRFCGIYPSLGEPVFSRRGVADVLGDLASFAAQGRLPETLFLGDADPLGIPLEESLEILRGVRRLLPGIRRVTAYARASTLKRIGREGIARLAGAGLGRVHVGLESGDRRVLAFQRKGQTPELVVETGRWLKAARVEISYYVLLGLGGRERWREHADATAAVLEAVDPEHIRVRRLWIYGAGDVPEGIESPLWGEIRAGRFHPQTPEGTVRELRRIVAAAGGLTGRLECDHANNFVRLSGRLPADRETMLRELEAFLALPEGEQERRCALIGSRI